MSDLCLYDAQAAELAETIAKKALNTQRKLLGLSSLPRQGIAVSVSPGLAAPGSPGLAAPVSPGLAPEAPGSMVAGAAHPLPPSRTATPRISVVSEAVDGMGIPVTKRPRLTAASFAARAKVRIGSLCNPSRDLCHRRAMYLASICAQTEQEKSFAFANELFAVMKSREESLFSVEQAERAMKMESQRVQQLVLSWGQDDIKQWLKRAGIRTFMS